MCFGRKIVDVAIHNVRNTYNMLYEISEGFSKINVHMQRL